MVYCRIALLQDILLRDSLTLVSSTSRTTSTGVTERPICIIKKGQDEKFYLQEDEVKKIFTAEDVKGMKCVVVSVAGACRKGKSFLLNFFIRYLCAKDKSRWVGDPYRNLNLEGFKWRGGSERETVGIWIWSKPFKCETTCGEKVSVWLMDTQGSFDHHSTTKEWCTIFGLSALFSSVQILNLKEDIQEDNLQFLELFSRYAEITQENEYGNIKLFQDLLVLVRDWSCPYDYDCGLKGGSELFQKRIEVKEGQGDEQKSLRKYLNSAFRKKSGFLMPHPGLQVSNNEHFNGKIREIEKPFLKYLDILVTHLFSGDGLIVKKVRTDVTNEMMYDLMQAFTSSFHPDNLPNVKSVYEQLADSGHILAVEAAEKFYTDNMERTVEVYVDEKILEEKHIYYHKEAIDQFNDKGKFGTKDLSAKYASVLESSINAHFERFKTKNYSQMPLLKKAKIVCIQGAKRAVVYVATGTVAGGAAKYVGGVLLTYAADALNYFRG